MTKKDLFIFLIGSVLLPLYAFASVSTLLDNFYLLLQGIAVLGIALSTLYFFWGLVVFMSKIEGKIEEGKRRMIWGIVALVVMSSIFGIVRFLNVAFYGIDSVSTF